MRKRGYRFATLLAIVLLVLGLVGQGWAQQVQLLIWYRLPDNPDLKYSARNIEANALSQRNIEIQACANGSNSSECEKQAEIAFRRRISAIPGTRFILAYAMNDERNRWLFDLTPDEAVDPKLDQVFNHLQTSSAYWLGMYMELGSCQLVSNMNRRTISYREDFRSLVCKILQQNELRNATGLFIKLIDDKTHSPDAHEIAFLLDHGVDANQEFSGGYSFLITASVNGHTDAVKLLLDHGANVDNRCYASYGQTALIMAAVDGRTDIVKILLDHGANVNAKEIEEKTAFGRGETALMHAAYGGHTDVVRILLDHGADVNARNQWLGYTALAHAVEHGHIEIVKLLLSHGAGATINATARGDGFTSLMMAAAAGRADIVKLLLDNGATVDITSATNKTALEMAKEGGHTDVVTLLLQHGATE